MSGTAAVATAQANAGPDESAALSLRDFSVTYTTNRHVVEAVRHVDLTVRRAEVLGVVGESGCGKSSLALGLLHLLPKDKASISGSVRIGSQELVGASDATLQEVRWRDVSVVPQSAMNALSPVLRIGDQIVDVVRAHTQESKRSARKTAEDVLVRVGLGPEHARSFPHELSGGMRQRAVIAMAIALEPAVVVLDEPTTALDVVTQQLVLEQIMELREEIGFSLIFITHDLPLLLEWSDRIAVMYAGGLVEVGPQQQIAEDPMHPYTRKLLGSFPSLRGPRDQLSTIPGQPWDLRRRGTGCLFAPRCDARMDICTAETPALTTEAQRAVACFLHHPNVKPVAPTESGSRS